MRPARNSMSHSSQGLYATLARLRVFWNSWLQWVVRVEDLLSGSHSYLKADSKILYRLLFVLRHHLTRCLSLGAEHGWDGPQVCAGPDQCGESWSRYQASVSQYSLAGRLMTTTHRQCGYNKWTAVQGFSLNREYTPNQTTPRQFC